MTKGKIGIGDSYGIVSLAFAADRIEFPITKRDLMDQLGDRKIMWTRNQSIQLEDVLEDIEHEEFSSFAELFSAITHYEDQRIRKLDSF